MTARTVPFAAAGSLQDASFRGMELAPSSMAIEARLDRLPMTRHIWRLVGLIGCGGLFEGYDLFMTGYVAPGLFRSGILTPTTTSLFGMTGIASFIGSFFTGLFIGTLLLSQLADRLGRRRTFTLALLWYSVATAMIALQSTANGVNLWRVIAGIGVGVELTTIDTFVSELVPRAQRGRAVALTQAMGLLAVPICALAAWLLVPQDPFGIAGWRFVVLIGGSGALFVWLIQRGLPESPRWLLQRGRIAEAEAVTRMFEAQAEAELGAALPAPAPSAACLRPLRRPVAAGAWPSCSGRPTAAALS